jgi:hypothetical protein
VLGEPALGVKARVLDLAVAVEQHNGGARRWIGGERADEAYPRFRCVATIVFTNSWTRHCRGSAPKKNFRRLPSNILDASTT